MDRTLEKPRLGQLLVRAGVLDAGSLARALAEQERRHRPLGSILVELGFLSEQVLVATLGHQLGLPIARIASWPVNAELCELVPAEIAEKYRCLPLALKGEGAQQSIYLAMADPSDLECLEAVRVATGREVRVVLVAPSEMEAALARHYRDAESRGSDAAPGEAERPPEADDPELLHRWSVSRDDVLALIAEEAASPEGAALAAANQLAGSLGAAGFGAAPNPIRIELDRRRLEELDGMVKLLMQLLVEAGVVSRDDLVRRLCALVQERR